MNYYSYSRTVEGYDFMGQSEERLRVHPFYRVHGHFGSTDCCPYCSTDLYTFRGETTSYEVEPIDHFVKACPQCKWWRYMMRVWDKYDEFETIAILSRRSVVEDDAPVEEIRDFLVRNWGARRQISPHKCQELVADVFKGILHCEVHYHTGSVFAKDKGIDFVLVSDETGIAYAFQVKRRQTEKRECVKCVREFIGSLAQSSYEHGYFVTTAGSFTRDAWIECNDSAATLSQRGMAVTLVDGASLYRALKTDRKNTAAERGLVQVVLGCDSKVGVWQWCKVGPSLKDGQLSSRELLATCGVQQPDRTRLR